MGKEWLVGIFMGWFLLTGEAPKDEDASDEKQRSKIHQMEDFLTYFYEVIN
jgi:hypothetical protein